MGMHLTYLVYGLAFLALGLCILIYPKEGSHFRLAQHGWMIAAFGIAHGLNEWLDLVPPLEAPLTALMVEVTRLVTLPVSYFFLLWFGVATLVATTKKLAQLRLLLVALPTTWVILVAVSPDPLLAASVFSRYLLGAPGAFLTAAALMSMLPEVKAADMPAVARHLKLVSGCFFAYGCFSGLVVPPAASLSTWIDYSQFVGAVGVPVQEFRAFCAVVIAISMTRILGLFALEARRDRERLVVALEHALAAAREAFAREQQLARLDSLTNLANSRAFFERAALEVSRARRSHRPLTVGYIDLDNFKKVNDAFGHQTGDAVLHTVAVTLKEQTRPSDLVARLGGDEFVVLVPDLGPEQCKVFLERLCWRLADVLKARRWPVTVSIGATTFLEPPEDATRIVARSDELMYLAKQAGKNRVRFEIIPPRMVGAASHTG
jgi:diguanylate cyclase (GGDEF)-like protein